MVKEISKFIYNLSFRPFFWWWADSRAIESLSALLAWWWGLYLIIPGDSGLFYFPAQETMLAIASENVWAIFFCLVAFIQSAAMCGNVKLLRYPSALVALVCWTMITTMFVLSTPITHAVGVYMLLALAHMWIIFRGPRSDGK